MDVQTRVKELTTALNKVRARHGETKEQLETHKQNATDCTASIERDGKTIQLLTDTIAWLQSADGELTAAGVPDAAGS